MGCAAQSTVSDRSAGAVLEVLEVLKKRDGA
jgi:hypothetical protein